MPEAKYLLSAGFDLSPMGQFGNLGNVTVESLIAAAVGIILIVASLSFFFSLIIGGIRWILSGGNKEKTETARAQVVNALIGIIIVFSAWAILNLVNEFFGINILSLEIPTF